MADFLNTLKRQGTDVSTGGGGGGALSLTVVEIGVGSVPRYSGTFTIAGSGMTVGRPVVVQQHPGPYTGKGTLADEAEMDHIDVTALVETSTVIRAYWHVASQNGPVVGNVKFAYAIG